MSLGTEPQDSYRAGDGACECCGGFFAVSSLRTLSDGCLPNETDLYCEGCRETLAEQQQSDRDEGYYGGSAPTARERELIGAGK